MIVYLNGKFVPEERARISIYDRGFLYGDGLFETIRVYGGEPFLWEEHRARFMAGCEALRIKVPHPPEKMQWVVRELLRKNELSDAIARIAISRGVGPRGYSPRGAECSTFCAAVFALSRSSPDRYSVITSTIPLPGRDALASFKHSNKVRQILARAEADDADANEALMLSENGRVLEGTTSNLFWVENKMICTPPLQGVLPGTTRGYVMKLAKALRIATREKSATLPDLFKASGIFLTSCGIEVMEVTQINGRRVNRSPLVRKLKRSYRRIPIE